MGQSKDYGLLIAALVAIVAVVGLVILFRGGNTGAVTTNKLINTDCPNGYWTYVYSANSGGGWLCSGDTLAAPIGGSYRDGGAYQSWAEGREMRKRQPSEGFTD